MKKTVFTIIFLCSVLIQMMAQNKILVSERIFLTPTHVYYDKNDTVEIIGQILSTNYSDFYPYSRYVYLELFDKDSKLVSRQKVRCNDKGCFYATMPLGAIKENGKYYEKHIVPPLLIYADLMGSGYGRNIETAKIILENELPHLK